ncbi:hypothetical protein MJO28_011446 [Puccinia striiformis f. sp. tritici]|uniref:Uncharacterized protein n=1 Tax=Puccinia striiformis f. sp. tritici TaxID=168172 RepID=A0ACC0E295_9BASI|nr:hypothetical protein MJO28_011446 [Puccinia striiformis f. sp. tritici]KAI7946688.1 hypothetical protein MJO29_011215 [Puccinia striiformis f. sp. tritici]
MLFGFLVLCLAIHFGEAFKIFPKQISHGPKHVKGSYRFNLDSGVCETTPGVKTFSGYIDIGNNQSMFFWFFEARNNPKHAPLALWLNGGPGCSSLFGALQENGPCRINDDSTASTLNPYSWNTYAVSLETACVPFDILSWLNIAMILTPIIFILPNSCDQSMLYIDQPISVGFSYGKRDAFSTDQAAARVWQFLQTFLSIPSFSHYLNDNGITFWSESYGGHYGPKFTEFFRAQNALIKAQKLQGHSIPITSLGINNGWFDPLVQFQSYYDYSQKKYNHVEDIANAATLAVVKTALTHKTGCLAQLKNCANKGNIEACQDAYNFCAQYVSIPLLGDRSTYYFPHNKNDTFPSLSLLKYLDRSDVRRAIGAETNYWACRDDIGEDFWTTADTVRPTISSLGKLLDSGLRTVIWAGDKDFICNSLGVYRSLLAMKWKYSKQFAKAPFKNLTVQGKVGGVYKTIGPLTFINVYNAGHEVPAFQPALSLEIFKQTISRQDIHSTN